MIRFTLFFVFSILLLACGNNSTSSESAEEKNAPFDGIDAHKLRDKYREGICNFLNEDAVQKIMEWDTTPVETENMDIVFTLQCDYAMETDGRKQIVSIGCGRRINGDDKAIASAIAQMEKSNQVEEVTLDNIYKAYWTDVASRLTVYPTPQQQLFISLKDTKASGKREKAIRLLKEAFRDI